MLGRLDEILRPGAAPPDGHAPLDRFRREGDLRHIEILALKTEGVGLFEAPLDQFDRLPSPPDAFLGIEAERVELLVLGPHSNAEIEAAVRENVDHRHVLRHTQRIVERQTEHLRADPHRFGLCSNPGAYGERRWRPLAWR